MNTPRSEAAFTLIEMLVVIIVLAVLAALLLPAGVGGEKVPARRVMCMSNQKQIALDIMLWEEGHGGHFPWQLSATNGGSMESISKGLVFPHFQTLPAELADQAQWFTSPTDTSNRAVEGIRQLQSEPSNFYFKIGLSTNEPPITILVNGQPAKPGKFVIVTNSDVKLFTCPADESKHAATNRLQLRDENISYFLNVDASTNQPPNTMLLGDRNLQADGRPVKPGLFVLTTNSDMSWTHELHSKGGSMAFLDGHVEWVRTTRLNDVVQDQPLATTRLVVP
jgi:prepilin-type N-terminal cleavage/methylation domain-containing protein/prepilin-type processing-associated H-X9-DG protein